MTEEELIRRSQAGDWNAFELLLERHRTALARTAYLVTRDREAIQDVMQEALIQVWRDLRSYRPYGSFKAWMLKITLNKARKHYRKKRVQTVPLEAATQVSGTTEGSGRDGRARGTNSASETGPGPAHHGPPGGPDSEVLQRTHGAGNRQGAGLPTRDHQVPPQPGTQPPRAGPVRTRSLGAEVKDDA